MDAREEEIRRENLFTRRKTYRRKKSTMRILPRHSNVRSEVGMLFSLIFYHRNKMAAAEEDKSIGNYKWKILEHLCKVEKNSEWEEIVTQKMAELMKEIAGKIAETWEQGKSWLFERI